MPKTKVLFYREGNIVSIVDWLEEVFRKDRKAVEKCYTQIELLKTLGYELRRPHGDFLRDGIYELRVSFRRVQYRMLYFFYGQNAVILTHGIIKEGRIPDTEINRAIERKRKFEANPKKHAYKEKESSHEGN